MKHTQKLYSVAAVAAVLFLFGCNNNTKTATISPQSRSGVQHGSSHNGQFPVAGGYSPGIGTIFIGSGGTETMTMGMRYLLSAYIDPANVGDVSPTNGVLFRGYVEGNGSGPVSATSGFELEIRDSYAGQKNENGEEIPAMKLGAAATSYQYNSLTGVAIVVFRTQNAEYKFEGTVGLNEYTGNFSFNNLASYSASEPNRSGSGIGFRITTCQFFRCQ